MSLLVPRCGQFAMLEEGPLLAPLNTQIVNENGGNMLLHAGQSYHVHRKNKYSTVWTCSSKKNSGCRGAVKIDKQTNSVKVQSEHCLQCVPNYFRNKVKAVLQKTKDEICRSNEPVEKVYKEHITCLKNQGHDEDIPTFNNVKHQLYSHRKKHLNVKKMKNNV